MQNSYKINGTTNNFIIPFSLKRIYENALSRAELHLSYFHLFGVMACVFSGANGHAWIVRTVRARIYSTYVKHK